MKKFRNSHIGYGTAEEIITTVAIGFIIILLYIYRLLGRVPNYDYRSYDGTGEF